MPGARSRRSPPEGRSAGGVVLTRTAATVRLDTALSAALAPWRRPLARHDPGKVVLDLALSLAIGGDCLAGIGHMRPPGACCLVNSSNAEARYRDG